MLRYRELYQTILIDTPVGPYFESFLQSIQYPSACVEQSERDHSQQLAVHRELEDGIPELIDLTDQLRADGDEKQLTIDVRSCRPHPPAQRVDRLQSSSERRTWVKRESARGKLSQRDG